MKKTKTIHIDGIIEKETVFVADATFDGNLVIVSKQLISNRAISNEKCEYIPSTPPDTNDYSESFSLKNRRKFTCG